MKWILPNKTQDYSKQSVLESILNKRGLTTIESQKFFLEPQFEDLLTPKKIPDLLEAVALIEAFIVKQEKITVYGDYDMDGINGTCLLVSGLKKVGAQVDFYIPHRNEGISLNTKAIDQLYLSGTRLIITVDNGSSAKDEIDYAHQKGMQLIIADHHSIPETRPPVAAFVNPKTLPGNESTKSISGTGIAFFIVLELFRNRKMADYEHLSDFLDLAAMGTIADMVPLLHENRTLAYFGLKQINEHKRFGIQALLQIAGHKKKVGSHHVGFTLGPRINAAGRLDHAHLGVELLLSESLEIAKEHALTLDKLNTRRQKAGEKILQEAEKQIESLGKIHPRCLVLHHADWHAGMIGITASQILRKYQCVAVVIGQINNSFRGSIRGLPGLKVTQALAECSALLEEFGGHDEAAGFSILPEKIPEFSKAFEMAIERQIQENPVEAVIEIDAELEASQINIELAESLQKLQPFGKANPDPIFLLRNVEIKQYQTVGDGTHLKMQVGIGEYQFPAIGFGMSKHLPIIQSGTMDLVFHLGVNTWKEQSQAQLQLLDMKPSPS